MGAFSYLQDHFDKQLFIDYQKAFKLDRNILQSNNLRIMDTLEQIIVLCKEVIFTSIQSVQVKLVWKWRSKMQDCRHTWKFFSSIVFFIGSFQWILFSSYCGLTTRYTVQHSMTFERCWCFKQPKQCSVWTQKKLPQTKKPTCVIECLYSQCRSK